MSKLKNLSHDLAAFRSSEPRLSDKRLIPITVQAKNRREKAKLNPSDHELVVLYISLARQAALAAYSDSVVMSTDVMRPPAETDIGRRGSELWLEREGAPEDLGVLTVRNTRVCR